ncbi:MAG: ABC transporter ATP-binding protein [Bacteroidales bacterium]|nr:ABC transporter ATP-binding protein [Bacteroidales bacterium]
MIKLKLQNTNIGYVLKKKSKILLQNINISAEEGELIALIGINGSGKSTLLRTIIGLQQVLSGNIIINGINQTEYNKPDLAKIIAFVSSEIIQTKYLKVKDVVSLGRFPHQKFTDQNSEKDKKFIKTALETVGMSNFKDRYISEISDGERQKIMTARALAQDTDIILADEPAAFLDLESKFALYKILSNTAKNSGKTIIFSTHDLNIALKYCDKVWLIRNKTIYEGSPEDLIVNGMLQNMFSDKHVIFNSETFEFSVKSDKKYPVKIINNSQSDNLKNIVINGLQRKGFYISDKPGIPIVKTERNSNFIIIKNNKRYEAKNIYDLLKILGNKK